MAIRWFYYAAPQNFYALAGRLWPWLAVLATALGVAGLWVGFALAPEDAQQGEGYRIIFVHVPVSWMSMVIYLAMAFWSILGLTFNTRLSGMMTRALAPTGAMFTFLSLWTGALWGKPMWGAWWVWDARLTSELVLLFLYLGVIGLYNGIEDKRTASRAVAILALVGVVNIPIIHYSVEWWNTLHQGATVSKLDKPSIHIDMLIPLLVMALAFKIYYVIALLLRCRNELLEREPNGKWIDELLEKVK